MAKTVQRALLTDEMLARFDERAPVYDRDNTFFKEDFDELVESGYTKCAVPTEYGGSGLALDEYSKLGAQLADVAPAPPLALNKHNYWNGIAPDLPKKGGNTLGGVLQQAGA